MYKSNQRIEQERALRARAQVREGKHMVVPSKGLLPGVRTTLKGVEYRSLTQARKAVKLGEAIVRMSDGIVVSVK